MKIQSESTPHSDFNTYCKQAIRAIETTGIHYRSLNLFLFVLL